MERIEETKADDLILNESLNMPQIGISETKTRYEERLNEFWEKRNRQFKLIDEMGGLQFDWKKPDGDAAGTIIFSDGSCCCTGTGHNCGEIKEDFCFPLSKDETIQFYKLMKDIKEAEKEKW